MEFEKIVQENSEFLATFGPAVYVSFNEKRHIFAQFLVGSVTFDVEFVSGQEQFYSGTLAAVSGPPVSPAVNVGNFGRLLATRLAEFSPQVIEGVETAFPKVHFNGLVATVPKWGICWDYDNKADAEFYLKEFGYKRIGDCYMKK